jgi:ribonuclease Z
MEIVTLGTGSPLPDPNRAGPATLVRAGGGTYVVDCGRGVQLRMAAAGAAAAQVTAVLLTHLHSDHVTDFNDLVTTRWITSPGPNPLVVYGPRGTQRFVDANLAMLAEDVGYRVAHHEDLTEGPQVVVHEVERGEVLRADGVVVVAEQTDHAPVQPTVGYRFEADGAVAVLAGDTVPCAGLDALCSGADLYVQTTVREALIRPVPFQRFVDVLDYHSTTAMAGATAKRNGVGHLVLTHLVPAPQPGTEGEWLAEVAAHFDGQVTIASDLDVFVLGATTS